MNREEFNSMKVIDFEDSIITIDATLKKDGHNDKKKIEDQISDVIQKKLINENKLTVVKIKCDTSVGLDALSAAMKQMKICFSNVPYNNNVVFIPTGINGIEDISISIIDKNI